jgi:DNA-directed RNA polymerase subunit M/transcription elongation factor TFIIS
MRTWLLLILVAVLAICFTLDPTPTIAEDTTDKIIDRQPCNLHFTHNNNNSDNSDQKKNVDLKHFCPNCKSSSLTFEGLSTYDGKQIQIINCEICGYEWQESWTLPNWFWLKSSSPNCHWTSERWNQE